MSDNFDKLKSTKSNSRDMSVDSHSSNSSAVIIEGGHSPSQALESAESKNARAQLRIEFMNTLFKLTGKPCQISFEQTPGPELEAIFSGCDLQYNNIVVNQLKTNIGIQSSAILRRTDIRSITFEV